MEPGSISAQSEEERDGGGRGGRRDGHRFGQSIVGEDRDGRRESDDQHEHSERPYAPATTSSPPSHPIEVMLLPSEYGALPALPVVTGDFLVLLRFIVTVVLAPRLAPPIPQAVNEAPSRPEVAAFLGGAHNPTAATCPVPRAASTASLVRSSSSGHRCA